MKSRTKLKITLLEIGLGARQTNNIYIERPDINTTMYSIPKFDFRDVFTFADKDYLGFTEFKEYEFRQIDKETK